MMQRTGGNVFDILTLWKAIWKFLSKGKCSVTIRPSNSNLSHIPERNENTCPHKNVYVNVHNRFLHDSQETETTHVHQVMSGQTKHRITKEWVIIQP